MPSEQKVLRGRAMLPTPSDTMSSDVESDTVIVGKPITQLPLHAAVPGPEQSADERAVKRRRVTAVTVEIPAFTYTHASVRWTDPVSQLQLHPELHAKLQPGIQPKTRRKTQPALQPEVDLATQSKPYPLSQSRQLALDVQPATRRSARVSSIMRPGAYTEEDSWKLDEEDGYAPVSDSDPCVSDMDEGTVVSSEAYEEDEPEEYIVRRPRRQKSKPTQGSEARRPSLELSGATSSIDHSDNEDKGKDQMLNLVDRGESRRGIHEELAPLTNIRDIFNDLTQKAVNHGLGRAVSALKGRPLRVATMCSGTESPLLALEMIRDALRAQGHSDIAMEHVFSAEIEPYKQAYIERNFRPPIIFRDIVEITRSKDGMATTAYGAKVAIPDNVDIVIAGTSCVDFSGLNRMKKGLNDRGESGDTFNAVLNYAKKFRPRILILENVHGAPWNSMLAKYEANEYSSAGVLVDTKEYYLPQTRSRGYMVCIDRQDTNLSKAEGAEISRVWQSAMVKLKRPVSAPISSFLCPSDDGEVILSRDRIARQQHLDPIFKEVDWSLCEERHKNYRLMNKLGTAKPYTSWEPSGLLVLNDYADTAWHRRQVERVWDFEECSLLRKAREYDVQFKTRIWDVSQNIDRFMDGAPFGISSCLTPSGNFFLTDRGGPLTFAETLALQGLPFEKLEFVSETERQVQDLAGNAMSTTVVGAALAAALISAGSVLKQAVSHRQPKERLSSSIEEIAEHYQLLRHSVDSYASAVNVPQLVQHATATMRKCYCEGQVGIAPSPIQVCVDCNHTTCLSCGIKPIHNYQPSLQSSRQSPESFIQRWRSKLPMRLRLDQPAGFEALIKDSMAKSGSKIALQDYLAVIDKAFKSDFKYSHFKRSQCWTVTYKAKNANLVLTIDRFGPSWSVFAMPDPSLPGNDPLRIFLHRPIARCTIGEELLVGGAWQWRIPYNLRFALEISPSGDKTPAWLARLNLPGEQAELSQALEIRYVKDNPDLDKDISGTYQHLKHCGTACEALYCRTDPLRRTPLFLFLDPTRLGQGKDDKFVFSVNPERLQYDETRDTVASIESSWRPWHPDISSAVGRSDSRWLSDCDISIHVQKDELDIRSLASERDVNHHENCSHALTLVTCEFPVHDDVPECYRGAHQILPNDKSFFNAFAYALEPLRQYANLGKEYSFPSDFNMSCDTCAPPLPEVRWHVVPMPSAKTIAFSMRPFEDSQSATRYEIRLKNRPSVFVVQSSMSEVHGVINIGFNHLALGQRAFAKLQQSTTTGYQSTSWTLDTAFSKSSITSPARFHIPSNDTSASFDIRLPGKKSPKERFALFEKQQQSLAWMRSQEAGEGKKFVLEAVEEVMLPHAGWRAEACARAEVCVRGGIAADHPGFGKTITSLALIHAEFNDFRATDNPAAEIIRRMKTPLLAPNEVPPIKLAATIVILPTTIVKQWRKEIDKILGAEYTKDNKTLVIETVAQLDKYNIKDFQRARIILLNRELLGRETYLRRLANFAGIPVPGSGSAKREFRAWLKFAVSEVRAHVKIMETPGKSALDLARVIKNKFEERLENDAMRSFANLTLKRRKGKDYVKQRMVQPEEEDDDDEAKGDLKGTFEYKVDAQKLKKTVLFEMFHYNRIIVDEFSYILGNKDGALTSITSLIADKRWGLSATPPLRDPLDVARLARLLGINLPGGLNVPGMVSVKNLESMQEDLTNAELFETFRHAPSHILQGRIYENAQRFLDAFVRQNILTFDDFAYKDYVVPVTLDEDHRLVYSELLQHLNSSDMRVKKIKAANVKGQDKDERIHDATNKAQDAENALSNRAAFFSFTAPSVELEPASEEPVSDGFLSRGSDEGQLLIKRKVDRDRLKEELRAGILEAQVRHLELKKASGRGSSAKHAVYPFERWQEVNLVANEPEINEDVKEMIAQAELMAKSSSKGDCRNTTKTGGTKGKAKKGSKRNVVDHEAANEPGDDLDLPTEAATKETKLSPADRSKEQNAEISSLLKKYFAATRTLRFVQTAKDLRTVGKQRKPLIRCNFEDCAGGVDIYKTAVSSICGHIICESCLQSSRESLGLCRAGGCKSSIKGPHLLKYEKLANPRPDECKKYTNQGRKIDKVIEIFLQVRKNGEQGILFVRRREDIGRMVTVLEANGIQCLGIDAEVSSRIEQFQNDTRKSITVIILNADDESAAGANLTGANHVVFLSPILKTDQYGYDSQMAQAIGRVRRHGQDAEHIFVYRMVSLDTLDVDVLEHRERTNRVLVEIPANGAVEEDTEMVHAVDERDAPFTADDRSAREERTQLIRDTDGRFKLVPKSLLLRRAESEGSVSIEGGSRVKGFEDFSSLVKFSKSYSIDD